MQCEVCGDLHPRAVLYRDICLTCFLADRNGYHLCRGCSKERLIFNKAGQFCKPCYQAQRAPQELRRYVERYSAGDPYHQQLFAQLAATVQYDKVKQHILQEFQVFGDFLQTLPFTAPVTWDALEAAMPIKRPARNGRQHRLRGMLLQLGHLLAAKGQMETREAFLARRATQVPIARAPTWVQPYLQRHAQWLQEHQRQPSTVRNNLDALANFWLWCEQREVVALYSVTSELVGQYALSLRLEWRCRGCGFTAHFDQAQKEALSGCPVCSSPHKLQRVSRLRPRTIMGYRSALRVFFAWAKLSRLVLANPVLWRPSQHQAAVRHYPPHIINDLCRYMTSAEADPREAIVLYLIIFHAFSAWELRHALLPEAIPPDRACPQLADAYHVVLPRRLPSAGDHSPGRPGQRVDFLPSAADWLKPLLRRFEEQRQEIGVHPSNRYLLVPQARRRHSIPTSQYAKCIIRRVSRRVLGRVCNLLMLRRTAAVLLADEAGGGILQRLGWDGGSAYWYAFAPREVVLPPPAKTEPHAEEAGQRKARQDEAASE